MVDADMTALVNEELEEALQGWCLHRHCFDFRGLPSRAFPALSSYFPWILTVQVTVATCHPFFSAPIPHAVRSYTPRVFGA